MHSTLIQCLLLGWWLNFVFKVLWHWTVSVVRCTSMTVTYSRLCEMYKMLKWFNRTSWKILKINPHEVTLPSTTLGNPFLEPNPKLNALLFWISHFGHVFAIYRRCASTTELHLKLKIWSVSSRRLDENILSFLALNFFLF